MSWLGDLFGGGSSNKTTTTTNSAPWAAAQPALKLGIKDATKLYNSDKNGSYYTGSTVVPWDKQSTAAASDLYALTKANRAGDSNGMTAQYQDIINQGGYNDAQLASLRALQAMPASGLSAAQNSAMGGLQALARDPFNSYQDAALKNTQNIANSKFDINSNPAFQKVLQQAQGAARESVNMSAGGAGRYGGGVHQGNLASEVGDLTSRMVGSEYQNWQNRADTANQNLFNMGQTGVGTQLNANTGAANIGQQGIANRQNTQSAIFGMGQAAQGNMGNAYTSMKMPIQDRMQIGAMKEDLATRQMNDKLRLFNEKNQAPWDQIARLQGIASGSGQLGGTTTQSAPGQNPFLTAMGYGATALGGLGSFI